jgi:hypothetical protein
MRWGHPQPRCDEGASDAHEPRAGETHDADIKVIPPVPQGALGSRRAQVTVAYWPAST